jgi:hypothetical protein
MRGTQHLKARQATARQQQAADAAPAADLRLEDALQDGGLLSVRERAVWRAAVLRAEVLRRRGAPECRGPLLLHTAGEVECHGPGCPGAWEALHPLGAWALCSPRMQTWGACPRCTENA